MSEFNFGDIFQKSFGYEAPKENASINIPSSAKQKRTSDLGQPFYASDFSGVEFFLPVTINGLLIPFAVIGMTWKKTIVSTPMPERGGSVKELISIDDYDFNVKGIVMGLDGNYPEFQVSGMHNLFKINSSVIMRSVLSDIVLNGINDHKVIIRDIKWPAVAGIEHAKPFEMVLESDMILELELNETGISGLL